MRSEEGRQVLEKWKNGQARRPKWGNAAGYEIGRGPKSGKTRSISNMVKR